MVESLSRVAEQLVRAGVPGSLGWEGLRLYTHFQPVYCVRRGGCIGYEALIRASQLDGAMFETDRLFAEVPADRSLLLDWVCRALHLRKFATVDPGDCMLFMNIDPRAAMADAPDAGAFGNLIRYYGLPPERICVEVLQNECADEGLLREAVAKYRALGATIAMDDFGIGRSNFDRVHALRPDIVKVDRAMLARTVGDGKARTMLPSMVGLLHQIGTKVAVEGVETASEALLAIEAGGDYLQGNYFASPAATLPDAKLLGGIFAQLLRVQAPRRFAAVG